MKKGWLIIFWLLAIIIISILLTFLKHPTRANNIIQAIAIVTLVFVTFYYAFQTKRQAKFSKSLLEEQKIKRELEFLERRLDTFYNRFIENINTSIHIFKTRKLVDVEKLLEEPKNRIYFPNTYMISPETKDLLDGFFAKLLTDTKDERKRQLKPKDKEELFGTLIFIRQVLYEERKRIGDFISNNYPFYEKEIVKNQSTETDAK